MMTAREFNVAYAQSIDHQRRLVNDMNLLRPGCDPEFKLTDYSHTQRSTGERLDRGEAFDRHAMYLLVCWEVETRATPRAAYDRQ